MKKLIITVSVILLISMTAGLLAQNRGNKEVADTRSQTAIKTDNTKSVQIEKEELSQSVKTTASKPSAVTNTKSNDSRASQPAPKQTVRQEDSRTSKPASTPTQTNTRTSQPATNQSKSNSRTTQSAIPQSRTDTRSVTPDPYSRTSAQTTTNRSTQTGRHNINDDDFYDYSPPRTTTPTQTRTTTPTQTRTTTPAQTRTTQPAQTANKVPAQDNSTQRSAVENTKSAVNTDKDTIEKDKTPASQTHKEKQDSGVTYKVLTPDKVPSEQTTKAAASAATADRSAQPAATKGNDSDYRNRPSFEGEELLDPGRGNRPPHTGDGDNNHGGNGHGGNHGGGHGDGHGGGHGDNNNHGWSGYHNNHGWNWRPNYSWNWYITINNWHYYNPYYNPYYDWTWYNHPWNWYSPSYSWNWHFAYHNFGYVSYTYYYNWYPHHHWIVYPSFSYYYSWTNRILDFSGYLVIEDWDTVYPYSYGLMTRLPNGDFVSNSFDRYGNRLAQRLIDRYGHLNKKIYVEVRGYYNYDTQTIRVTSMKRVNWHRNVYMAFYYHPRWFRFGFWHWG